MTLSDTERQEVRARIRSAAGEQKAAVVLAEVRRLIRGTAKPAVDGIFAAAILDQMRDAIVAQTNARALKTFFVRSTTIEPSVPSFKIEAALLGLVLDLELGGYGSYVDELMNERAALAHFQPELVIVSLEVEDLAGRLPELCAAARPAEVDEEIGSAASRMKQMLQTLRNHSTARIVIQGFVLPDSSSLGDVGDANLHYSLPRSVARLNERLRDVCAAMPDCVFFDVDHVAARYGRRRWRDQRMFLASRLAVSADASGAYARALARSAASLFRPARKLLCTDLDNTLWGGILGEDGTDGIQTGSAFPGNCFFEYQRYLKQLASRGILLAAVSKNNEADVIEAFELRAADLALSLNDFVAKKISWNDKSQSLRELAQELSLGLDSFVFVDDNPVECEAIRRALPEVAVIGAPAEEPWRILELLGEEPLFDATVITEDDVNRTQEYRAQVQRAELETHTTSREEFLGSLGIVCTFIPAPEAPLARAVQLLAKTNQFNLTTRRHSAAEVERFAAGPASEAIAIRVRDRFGDAGIVGLALAETGGQVCRIDSLLLSCRVIGRGIETALLAEIAERARRAGAHKLLGEYIPTRKNALCANFYPDHAFTAVTCASDAAAGSVCYEFDLRAALNTPAWITLEGTEQYELAAGASITS